MKNRDQAPGSLEPCPLCGAPALAVVKVGAGVSEGFIQCNGCGARTPPGLSFEQAREEWRSFVPQDLRRRG